MRPITYVIYPMQVAQGVNECRLIAFIPDPEIPGSIVEDLEQWWRKRGGITITPRTIKMGNDLVDGIVVERASHPETRIHDARALAQSLRIKLGIKIQIQGARTQSDMDRFLRRCNQIT